MHIKQGAGANHDRKISIMRQATSKATEQWGIGGRKKQPHALGPKPVTLPKLKFLERPDPSSEPA